MSKRIKNVIRKITETKDGARLLKENPKKLAKQIGLSKKELFALFTGDIQIVHTPKNPLTPVSTITFTTGTTITASPAATGHVINRLAGNSTTTITFQTGLTITGQPAKFDELSKNDLIRVLNKSLFEPEFAGKLRNFIQ